ICTPRLREVHRVNALDFKGLTTCNHCDIGTKRLGLTRSSEGRGGYVTATQPLLRHGRARPPHPSDALRASKTLCSRTLAMDGRIKSAHDGGWVWDASKKTTCHPRRTSR